MKIDSRDIFEQIGALFYAIAADQRVKPLEEAELKLLISRDWLPRNYEETRSVVSDETHFILTSMDTLEGAEISAREAFNQFATFYKRYPDVFTTELIEHILDTAEGITRIFKADNPSVNTNLALVKDLFKKENVSQPGVN